MAELLSSKITITEEDPTIRSFPTLASAVLAISGVAEKGPIATPQLVTSYEEYERYFGTFVSGYQLALAVRSYFLNGGNQAYVSRVVHYTDIALPATKTSAAGTVTLQSGLTIDGPAIHTGSNTETFDMEPNDTLIGDIEGAGNDTATFTATAGYEDSNDTFPVSDQDGLTFIVTIDGGSAQTVTISGATTALSDLIDALNAGLVGCSVSDVASQIRIQSDSRGTGSTVSTITGTNSVVWTGAPVAGTGNVVDIDAVTVAEVKTVVEAAWTGGSGVVVTNVGSAVRVSTVSTGAAIDMIVGAGTANTVVGFTAATYSGTGAAAINTLKIDGKYDGAYANSLLIKIAAATSADASEFNLQVINANGVVVESFANLTMLDTDERFVETIVNHADVGSTRITVTDLDAGGATPTEDRPANTSGAVITTGDDGLASLGYLDFTGNQGAANGLYAFDLIDDITILACPENVTATMQKAMITYCETDRKGMVFSVLDPGVNLTTAAVIAQAAALGAEGVTEYAALYWPRVKIINPSKAIYGSTAETVTMAPSGMIAGIMANNDREESEGPFYQPAGTEGGRPYGIVDLERADARLESSRDLVYPKRINPITYLRGYGVFVDGSRTRKGTGNFPSVGERRGVSQIERLFENGLQWVRHRNNTPSLRRSVEKSVYAELHSWMRRGAFSTNDPSTAFFVDVSDALNPPSAVRAGKLVLRVGVATSTPAEFLIIKVTKDTRALDEELYGQG